MIALCDSQAVGKRRQRLMAQVAHTHRILSRLSRTRYAAPRLAARRHGSVQAAAASGGGPEANGGIGSGPFSFLALHGIGNVCWRAHKGAFQRRGAQRQLTQRQRMGDAQGWQCGSLL